ncbi:HAD-IIIA family hydrolase [Synechococcus sp. HB1133]|uniref:HAD-IIIA family hydrolase n=1 Tax=unclassified Synechococcus TaxID=2626047 RepID=UPI00140992AA|nr:MULTISPECIES: HAD-IIIA family hydrolase [unclassified Synechococcus]MCB4421471.1 HAD-IIIA family hydrolase [Synechococcus sp. HB1133]MCB4431178.1 HAD-IIIA family hydrolase [Synechococcus sp. HBA1120]NHI80413.1 HAD-IIIA family hydrolase [Synechococcus sp. HB1133]
MNGKGINQAVILCGGLGTRLRPVSLNRPKPMALVNGVPFLEHLIKQLKENDIDNILLLTGYKKEVIEDYFGDGINFDVTINYHRGPNEWETGTRIWKAKNLLDKQFILLYSDNYLNLDFEKLRLRHNKGDFAISLVLKSKKPGNVKWMNEDQCLRYTRRRDSKECGYVELGYMVVNREELISEMKKREGIKGHNLAYYIEELSNNGKVGGIELKSRYLSISDPDRLKITRKVFKPKKIILIDRDGTINQKAKRGEYITQWSEFKFIEESVKGMESLSKSGFKFIIISNQAGIARGMLTNEELKDIHSKMKLRMKQRGIDIINIYVSPDHWDQCSETRKPEPGLFFRASENYNLRLENCLYIGDDPRDCMAASNAGCGMVYLSQNNELPSIEKMPKPFIITRTIYEKVDEIKELYKHWGAS